MVIFSKCVKCWTTSKEFGEVKLKPADGHLFVCLSPPADFSRLIFEIITSAEGYATSAEHDQKVSTSWL